jgi:hypothetical protein
MNFLSFGCQDGYDLDGIYVCVFIVFIEIPLLHLAS